jgi:hypothetical protein
MDDVTDLLRDDLLEGRVVAVAGGGEDLAAACARLGAQTPVLEADPAREDAAVAAAQAIGRADALVVDTRPGFVAAGCGYAGLRAAADGAFLAARAATTDLFADAGGKTVLVAPPPSAGEHAGPARAALENAARSLSTEWARRQVSVVAVLPGDGTGACELEALVAFLCSEAGAYYSGCALTLGAG